MMGLFKKYPLISDQINAQELEVVVQFATKSLQIDGDFVEFGCFLGTTSLFLSRLIGDDKNLWVYDSFEGLPDKTTQDESPAGFAFKKGELLATKKQFILNYKKANLKLPIITKAWFSDLQAKDVPDKIAFAFLDGDYYGSIKTSLKLVAPKMVKNGFILVHDYGRVTLPGPKIAVSEFLQCNNSFKLLKVQEHIGVIVAL
jgi:O-methyltransferase